MGDDSVKFELSPGTLLYGEVVTEYKGEGKSQRKVKSVHIIDGWYLGGEDISSKHFMERQDLLRLFLHTMNKNSRNDYGKLRLKGIYKLHDLGNVEGDSTPRYFQPSGIMLIKTVKDPWMMALSRSQNRKYWYNVVTRESRFELPADSVSSSSVSFCKRLLWTWDSSTGVDPRLAPSSSSGGITKEQMDKFVSQ